jgi:hypothetical protein
VTVLFGWFRRRRELVLENAASRQQLAMHERRPPDIQDSERMFWVWLVRIWPGGRGVVIAVRPEMGRVMASGRLATLLDVEEQVEASWPAEHRPGSTSADHASRSRESVLGCGTHSGRATGAWP